MRKIPAIVGYSLATILAGYQPTPTVEESLARCPALVREGDADKAAFYAKSPLHKEYAEVFGGQGVLTAINERQPGGTSPVVSRYELFGAYAVRACIPVHGEEKCKGPVQEYSAYEERANKRMWEEIRYKCLSRTG
jgi:hypothetical protein